jgi:chemotaxis protein CheY-P-specific phosphatase CheC
MSDKEIQSPDEKLYIDEMMKASVYKAVESFYKLIGQQASLKNIVVTYQKELQVRPVREEQDHYHVLLTNVKGTLGGKSFLIMEEKDAQAIIGTCLTQKESRIDNLEESMLLEIDNILSATMITHIADQLSLFIYGDVPSIEKMNGQDLNKYIQNQQEQFPVKLFSEVEVESLKNTFQFIWLFDQSLLQSIKGGVTKGL